MIWTVGRYPSGVWDSGGKPDEYMGGWTCRVEAKDRIEALKKGKSKFYREQKKLKQELPQRQTCYCLERVYCAGSCWRGGCDDEYGLVKFKWERRI